MSESHPLSPDLEASRADHIALLFDGFTPAQVGAVVRREREKRNMSQTELAAKVGATQPSIDRLERGQAKRSRLWLPVTAVLGIDRHTLVGAVHASAPVITTLKIYSLAEALHDERHGFLSEAEIQTVVRSFPVEDNPAAFGVLMGDMDMFPFLDVGDIAVINPGLPLIRGSHCLFIKREDPLRRACIRFVENVEKDAWSVVKWDGWEGSHMPKADWQPLGTVVSTVARYR